ncbi:F-box protein CPR1-like [Silene latifolia]|uniref:F-box protein CPR1-like n=1 Tax=Silene latifolia TaxID=37657 RepID=UPI003D78879A
MVGEDILREILYRLSLLDLTTCKLINKECHMLINDPEFDRDKHRVVGDNAIVSTYVYEKDTFDVDVIRCNGANKEESISPFEYLSCKNAGPKMPSVLGSYNGLVGINFYDIDYMLWNPVTQERLDFSGEPGLVTSPDAVGFCYDSYNDEYMFVVIGTLRIGFENISCIELINFTTNTSKTVHWSPEDPALELRGIGTVVCGVPHWVKACDDFDHLWDRKRIIYFDPSNETFNEMEAPGHAEKHKRILGLGALDGQRQLGIVLQDTKNLNLSYDIWVMKEYGKPETWTYLCKIPSLDIQNYYEYVNLVGIKPGEVWVHHVRSPFESEELKLITYDPITKRIKNVQVSGGNDMVVKVTSYKPSFISPFNYKY